MKLGQKLDFPADDLAYFKDSSDTAAAAALSMLTVWQVWIVGFDPLCIILSGVSSFLSCQKFYWGVILRSIADHIILPYSLITHVSLLTNSSCALFRMRNSRFFILILTICSVKDWGQGRSVGWVQVLIRRLCVRSLLQALALYWLGWCQYNVTGWDRSWSPYCCCVAARTIVRHQSWDPPMR